MNKILVLGSEGQIMKPFVDYLKQKGHEVLGLDIVNGINQDVRHIDSFTKKIYFEWADIVIFAAWQIGGSKYISQFERTTDFMNHNMDIIRSVFQVLEDTKKPFIFLSSQMSNMIKSPYGSLKNIGEHYTKILGGVNVKFWNVFGHESKLYPNKFHVITDFINMAKNDGVIQSMTTGIESRQMIHTDDTNEALYVLCQNYDKLDKTRDYCITNFEWNTIREVAQLVADEFPGCKLEFARKSDTVQGGYKNEPDDYILQYWQPKYTLKEGIQKVIKDMENE